MLRHRLPTPSRPKNGWYGGFALILLGVISLSLVAIVQLQHQIRHLETQYASALQNQLKLKEEWGKLKLEKHHLTALARVEDIARNQLKMTLEKHPDQQNSHTIYLAPLAQGGSDKES